MSDLYLDQNSTKQDSLFLKQSILMTDLQSSESRLDEINSRLIQQKVNVSTLNVNFKSLNESSVQNSLRIDEISATTKLLEKNKLENNHEMKIQFLKMSDMLTAAHASESNWQSSSKLVQDALNKITLVTQAADGVNNQVQSMLEDHSSRNHIWNKRIESILQEVDSKIQSGLQQIRDDIVYATTSQNTESAISRIASMYQKAMADMNARRLRNTRATSVLLSWHTESLKAKTRDMTLRRLVGLLRTKLSIPWRSLERHCMYQNLGEILDNKTKSFLEVHEIVLKRISEIMIWMAEMEERITGLGQQLDTIKNASEGMNFMNLQSEINERVSEVRRKLADELARTREELTAESRRESDERRSRELVDETTPPDQVQDTLKDLLILWSSLKELEVKKVDKTVFTDEIGILESQIATIKGDLLNYRNDLRKMDEARHSHSASTVATLAHHQSDTLITRDPMQEDSRRGTGVDVENFVEMARRIFTPAAKEKYRPPKRPSSSGRYPKRAEELQMDKGNEKNQILHIVARKLP